jgi:hypothetical protein
MSGFLLITLLVLLAAAAAALYIYFRRQKRNELVALLTDGVDVLAHWTYTPAEWRKAVEEEFTWASGKDNAGEVYVSPTAIFIRTDSHDHLIDLADKGKVVTHASYRGTDDSSLKLRVRWKVITTNRSGAEHVEYHKEDYRIPVPPGAKEAAQRVADFFTAQLENDLDAYTALVGEDEPISLFGKDSF